jgi:AraC-like DNA-binding protein
MSDPITCRVNRGAYDRPFSGVGIEFAPLGIKPDRSGVSLHETGFLRANSDWNYPGVFSPFWRFYNNASCGHCVLFGERMVELVPGLIMLIPPHCLFHCLGRNPVPTFWMSFSFTHKLHRDAVPPVLLNARDTDLCLIRDLEELVMSNPDLQPNDATYRNSLALLQTTLARPELSWQPPVLKNLARVIDHIESRLNTKLTIQELAKLAGMSPPGFNRAFRSQFGTSPAHYVTEMRVREAARYLLQEDETIDTIAEKTGFPNRAYFSRVFKQIAGESPAGFRRRHKMTIEVG